MAYGQIDPARLQGDALTRCQPIPTGAQRAARHRPVPLLKTDVIRD